MARNRAAVKRRLKEIADYAFADPVVLADEGTPGIPNPEEGYSETVHVSYHWDGKTVPDKPTFFLGVTDGRADVVGIKRESARTDDKFDVFGYMAVPQFTTDDDGGMASEEAAERCLNVFEAVLRECR